MLKRIAASAIHLTDLQKGLLQVLYGPKAQAYAVWSAWQQANDIDAIGWQDHKLLALVTHKLSELDPNGRLRGRLRGLSKLHWTQTQLATAEALKAVDLLLAAGFPVMLLKGAAMDASGLALPGPRISGDLDIMISGKDFGPALKLLADAGWRMKYASMGYAKAKRLRPSMNLFRGENGDIDLHHQPIHSRILSGPELDGIWQRAQQITWMGRTLLIPDVNDQFLTAAVHAARSSRKSPNSPTWPACLLVLSGSDKFDINTVVDRAREWNVEACLEATVPHIPNLPDSIRRKMADLAISPISVALLLAGRLTSLQRTLLLSVVALFHPRKRFFELPYAAWYIRKQTRRLFFLQPT